MIIGKGSPLGLRDKMKPFHLLSGALYDARSGDGEIIYQQWRAFLKRLEFYRGSLDPMADQNANLDVLLRSTEETLLRMPEKGENLNDETSGFHMHLHLSRLWVLGTYEYLRTLHEHMRGSGEDYASCLVDVRQGGCGLLSCPYCAIGHTKNEVALVRMLLAKNRQVKYVKNPPLTEAHRLALISEAEALPPPDSAYLFKGEGRMGGTMAWHVYDPRVERYRNLSRARISHLVLNSLSAVTYDL